MEQLLQVVLKWGPRQQQLVIDLVAVQDPEELRGGEKAIRGLSGQPMQGSPAQPAQPYLGLVVLEPVGFVHHKAGPLDGAQDGLVDGDELVGGEQDVEFDLHFFLEGKRDIWGQSWEASGARSPETQARRRHGQEPPGTQGAPVMERKSSGSAETQSTERGGAENGAPPIRARSDSKTRQARTRLRGPGPAPRSSLTLSHPH